MPLNQKIPWDDRYMIGIEMIDEQHKKLFDLVNRLYDLDDDNSSKEELRIILYEFSDYMQTHFNEEEEYMKSINYNLLDEHKQLHADIIDNLALLVQTPAKLSIIKSKMRVVAKRALIDHIMHEDSKVILFLHEQENENVFDITAL
jgi:hemerythrin